jgi:serine protease Do
MLLPGWQVSTRGAGLDLEAIADAIKKTAAKNGPSVARIYVSRSDAYARARYWGEPLSADPLSQLGRFDGALAAKKVPEKAPHRTRILRTIRDHDLSDPALVPESYGSGFVIDEAGYVLTNAHVVRNATKIYVRLPGKRGSWADIHAADRRSDLAVLRLLDKVPDLAKLKLGAGEKVRVGQIVVALSNGYEPGNREARPAAAWGLVTGLRQRAPGKRVETDRAKTTLHQYGTLVQTDVRVTPGCSGGVLLNLDGEVVGLITALGGIRGGEKPGVMAIPIDKDTKRIIEVLRKGQEVEYGFLGVMLPQDARAFDFEPGVRISNVSRNSPAEKAGLRPRDVIVKINGQRVRENDDLFLLVGISLAGRVAKVEVLRQGENAPRTYSVKLDKFYVPGDIIASKRPPALGGIRVDYLSVLSQQNPFAIWTRTPAEGVVIREVVPSSAADKANLQADKVITHVNRKAVNSPAEYYREVARAAGRLELTILDSENRAERVTLNLKER